MRTSNISVTVDAVLFKKTGNTKYVLLIKRKNNPFKDKWALPGGFVDQNEDLLIAASRELMEETGLEGISLRQFHTFGKPFRDPRGHTISVAYIGMADSHAYAVAADDASEAEWFAISNLPELAFDHDDIIAMALNEKI